MLLGDATLGLSFRQISIYKHYSFHISMCLRVLRDALVSSERAMVGAIYSLGSPDNNSWRLLHRLYYNHLYKGHNLSPAIHFHLEAAFYLPGDPRLLCS